MSMRSDRITMLDMLSHAREAVDLLGDRNRAALERDRVLQLALTRLVEIIGEAANRVSAETQRQHPDIPWPAIIGMRNRLIHGTDTMSLTTICPH